MSSTTSINFLHTIEPSAYPRVSFWTRILHLPWLRALSRPVMAVDHCIGHHGGFIIERQLALPGTVRWTAGIVAVVTLAVLASVTYPIGHHHIASARSVTLPALNAAVEQARTQSATGSLQSAQISQESVQRHQAVPAPMGAEAPIEQAAANSQDQYKLQRDVYAFLPYWYVGKSGPIEYDKVSTLAYFGVEVQSDGTLNRSEPGWTMLYSEAGQRMIDEVKQHGTRLAMTYRSFNEDHIRAIVADAASRDRAAMNMVNQAKEVGATGANIDFENADHPDDALRQNFTAFVAQVKLRFDQMIPGSEVVVSTYASSASFYKLYDVVELANVSDGLFIMAYDFHTVNSGKVGPVAPLTGAPNTYWYDVTSTVKDHLSVGVAADKMILGVPYYGYDWPVVEDHGRSEVGYGRAVTSSYKGSVHDPNNSPATRHWDDASQTPYYTYRDGDTWRVTHYDDVASLGRKYDLANQHNLKGIGIWALGQQGDAPELWQLLVEKFGKDS